MESENDKINLNNVDSVLRKSKENPFPEEISRLNPCENGTYSDPIITDSNIENNSRFIVDMFCSEPCDGKGDFQKVKKDKIQKNIKRY